MKTLMVLVFAVTIVIGNLAFAGSNPDAKAAVHAIPHASRTCTQSFPSIASCGDITYSQAAQDADCFPVFFDLVEYAGFDYGMTWPGTYTCAFTSCSDLTIGGIVFPDDGISHAWTACKAEAVAITGWGWVYDSGLVCIVPHPEVGAINVGDCQSPSGIDNPVNSFCAGIGGYAGDDPCAPSATKPTTWGAIKSMFE